MSEVPEFGTLVQHTLRQQIAKRIKEAILRGSLREGERLVERTLARQFSISVTAVREALIELETEGFVAKRPNAATYVTKLTWADVEKISALRRILEVYAVEEAARKADPAQVEALEELYTEMLHAARLKDTRLFMQIDASLHEAIWAIGGNEYLQAALRRIFLPLSAFFVIRVGSGNSFDLLKDAEKHLASINAIRLHDPETAKAHFLSHMNEWLDEARTTVFQPDT